MNRVLLSTVFSTSYVREFSRAHFSCSSRQNANGILYGILLLILCLFKMSVVAAQEVAKEYYATGELKASGKIVNGLKDGEWLFYYPSGKKNSIENYKAGVLHGNVSYYYPDEVVQGREQWSDGKMQGAAEYFHAN